MAVFPALLWGAIDDRLVNKALTLIIPEGLSQDLSLMLLELKRVAVLSDGELINELADIDHGFLISIDLLDAFSEC